MGSHVAYEIRRSACDMYISFPSGPQTLMPSRETTSSTDLVPAVGTWSLCIVLRTYSDLVAWSVPATVKEPPYSAVARVAGSRTLLVDTGPASRRVQSHRHLAEPQ